MRVRWANYVSEAFTVSNGVRQGGVLSPYLFSVYMDGLSDKLNNTDAGCCIGNLTLNHIMYADDICCFAASAGGLQDLLDVCSDYAKLHDIVFNCKKTVGMIFSSKDMYTFMPCNMNIDGQKIKFVNNVVYLGVSISSDLWDDTDIARQVRYLYCAANKLKTRFFKCSIEVKNILFRAHCMCFYASQLWCNYSTSAINRLKVAYNDAYRILHGMPRYHSARESQIYYNIDSFHALQRKITYKFVERCHLSQNLWLKMLMSSDCFYDSVYYDHYCGILFVNE